MSGSFDCGLLGIEECPAPSTASSSATSHSSSSRNFIVSTPISDTFSLPQTTLISTARAPSWPITSTSFLSSTSTSTLSPLNAGHAQPASTSSTAATSPPLTHATSFPLTQATTTASVGLISTLLVSPEWNHSWALSLPASTQTMSSPATVEPSQTTSARTAQPQGWIIALIVLAVAALLSSIGACAYVYLSRWRKPNRASLSHDVLERYRIEDGTSSSLAMLPGSPRTPNSSSSFTTPSIYNATSALGSWTNLPLLTPTLSPGFDAQSQHASIHDAARQSFLHAVSSPDSQSLAGSRSISPEVMTSRSNTGATSASQTTTAKTTKTFVTDATAGSRPPAVPPLSEIPLPPVPISQSLSRAQSPSGHARANTQTSSKTIATAATAGSVGTPVVSDPPVVPETRVAQTPQVSGHTRADTETSSKTFTTEATQGSHPPPASRRTSGPSELIPHDPFAVTRSAPLAVASFPHWPPTPLVSNWPVPAPPQSPPPPPPPPVPPIPQQHRDDARVSGKSTQTTVSSSTGRAPPSYRTVAGS